MTEKRQIHTYAVVEEAKKLSQRYGEDMGKAELAALFHDFFRGLPEKALNGYVRQLDLDPVYLLKQAGEWKILTDPEQLKNIAPEKTEAFAKLEAWFKGFKQGAIWQRKAKGGE